MTPDNDGAQPNPADQPQPDPAVAAAAAAAPATAEPDAAVDIDDQDLNDAKAAVEAEKTAGGGDGEGEAVNDGKTPGQQQPGAQQDQHPQGDGKDPAATPVMIPKARFDEVLEGKSKAETDAAYWRGRAEAIGHPSQPGAQPGGAPGGQPQQPTADQRLATVQAEIDALAVKYDNGEISYSDLTKQQRDLTNKEQGIREEILLAKVKPAQAPADAGTDQLYLDTLTADIEKAHPWVGVFEQVGSDADWKYVRDRAADNLVARGVDPSKGAIGKYELRKEIGALMDTLGPTLVADRAKAKGIVIPGQAPPSPGGQQQQTPKLSPQAQARAAKLGQAANAPPRLSEMGGTAIDPADVPTDARIENMDEDEYDRLPDATRKRLLGTT